ncbi:MAG TPA: tRNA 2-thiouridine(34) synthase MnmA [Gemmataceae bacterium]|nr:tRNA 2-thiouridine(34) synthase MnmA [Gemmataceae bacterium]
MPCLYMLIGDGDRSFEGDGMAARVVLAMSGGVDSSTAALLLREQGYDVIGLFMRTGTHGREDARADRKKGCCSAVDAGDARRVADRLDIPFYALDFEKDFDRIIDYFADEYLAGRTPNPCVVCNSWLKFGQLWTYGRQIEADYIATGHYARVGRNGDEFELHRAADPDKDQSYVLYGLPRSILPHLLFPIGDRRKDEVRAAARAAGLGVADKPDSVEICFVPDGDHAALIRERRPQTATAGRIVDTSGRMLAAHDGIERFTVGQRKGLGFAAGERRYVLRIVPGDNEVVIGDKEDLLATDLLASRVNWLTPAPPSAPLACSAKIRYRHAAAPATVTALPDGGARVVFEEAQSAVTPGQAVVFYDGPRVLGGGWIESAFDGERPA